jgi:ABC-type molybdate transport system ATPase subunit
LPFIQRLCANFSLPILYVSHALDKGGHMTISNALIFIQRGQQENQLRQRLNAAPSILELQKALMIEQLEFSEQDFDQAFHLLLVKCQEVEEAEQLKGFKMWWTLLHNFLQTPPIKPFKEQE